MHTRFVVSIVSRALYPQIIEKENTIKKLNPNGESYSFEIL